MVRCVSASGHLRVPRVSAGRAAGAARVNRVIASLDPPYADVMPPEGGNQRITGRAQVVTCMGPVPPTAAPMARRLHGVTFMGRLRVGGCVGARSDAAALCRVSQVNKPTSSPGQVARWCAVSTLRGAFAKTHRAKRPCDVLAIFARVRDTRERGGRWSGQRPRPGVLTSPSRMRCPYLQDRRLVGIDPGLRSRIHGLRSRIAGHGSHALSQCAARGYLSRLHNLASA